MTNKKRKEARSHVSSPNQKKAKPQIIHKLPADCYYIPDFYSRSEADELKKDLQEKLMYEPRDHGGLQFQLFGRTVQLPRDKAFLGDVEEKNNIVPLYRYSGGKLETYPIIQQWTPTALAIRDKLAENYQYTNHLVANRYTSGKDHIGAHRDKSRDFVPGAAILTVSFGVTRTLRLIKPETKQKIELQLSHGSLFILGSNTNELWKHMIVQNKKITSDSEFGGVRLGLTYRSIATKYDQINKKIITALAPSNKVDVASVQSDMSSSSSSSSGTTISITEQVFAPRFLKPLEVYENDNSLLLQLAQFAINNNLYRKKDTFYDFSISHMNTINRASNIQKRVANYYDGGYIFLDELNGASGMIRLFLTRGGNPKWSFWKEDNGVLTVGEA